MEDAQKVSPAEFVRARLDEDERRERDLAKMFCVNITRVLRDFEAKRAILAAWQDNEAERGDALSYTDGLADGLMLAVQYLAAVWSDHPDYRP
jgi:Family of unknown function (DUF6221)